MNTAPFYKNTTFKVSKMWKMLLPHAWREKKKGRNKKILNISWLYFATLELHCQNVIFLFHPFKIHHIYAQFKVHYKYVLRVPSIKGR